MKEGHDSKSHLRELRVLLDDCPRLEPQGAQESVGYGQAQLLLEDSEGEPEVGGVGGLVDGAEVDEVGLDPVEEGAEEDAVCPGQVKVEDAEVVGAEEVLDVGDHHLPPKVLGSLFHCIRVEISWV